MGADVSPDDVADPSGLDLPPRSGAGLRTALGTRLAVIDRDRSAQLVGWVTWPLAVVVLLVVGRHQWFARDDWAFLFTRRRMGEVLGVDDMLLAPQDGHWMTGPVLVFRGLHATFGLGSYWPYLVTLLATHVGIVVLARRWMIRFGVSAWTLTLMTALLLLFGAGWENLVFAVQITYNFSLLAFLAHLLLVDHDGPLDRRDGFGVAVSLVGVSSSGFGPFFAFGTALLLVVRRRWWAAAVAVVPQAVAWTWWWLTWGADPAGDAGTASPRFIVNFTRLGIDATFGSLSGDQLLSGAALLVCLGVMAWRGTAPAVRAPAIALFTTAVVMYAGVGSRREVFGIGAAAWSRYQYMAALLVAPVLAVGIDHARRFAPWASWAVRVVLVVALARNVLWLHDGAEFWAEQSEADRYVFELVAGSPERYEVAPDHSMTEFSPDVRVSNLDELVEDGAIIPRPPANPSEQQVVDRALGLDPPGP